MGTTAEVREEPPLGLCTFLAPRARGLCCQPGFLTSPPPPAVRHPGRRRVLLRMLGGRQSRPAVAGGGHGAHRGLGGVVPAGGLQALAGVRHLPAAEAGGPARRPGEQGVVKSGLDVDEPQIRFGRLYLYSFNEDSSPCPLVEVQRRDTSAILDMKWYKFDNLSKPYRCHIAVAGHALLGVADAAGSIELLRLVRSENSYTLQPFSRFALEKQCLALSLDWSTGKAGRASDQPLKIISSDSSGQLHLLQAYQAGPGMQAVGTWQAHHFEAWAAAFDYWQTEVVYSGGDDGLLKGWDTRTPGTPVFTSRRYVTEGPVLGVGGQPSVPRRGLPREEQCCRALAQALPSLSDTPWACAASRVAPIARTSWPREEENQEVLPVTPSYTLPNSLVYGVDWSWLYFRRLPQTHPSFCLGSSPGSDPGGKTADPVYSLKVAAQSPAPCFECLADADGEGGTKHQSGGKLKTALQPFAEDKDGSRLRASGVQICECDHSLEAADFDISLVATCSFYDHVLHLWKWENS
eukprot:bmy_13896T0